MYVGLLEAENLPGVSDQWWTGDPSTVYYCLKPSNNNNNNKKVVESATCWLFSAGVRKCNQQYILSHATEAISCMCKCWTTKIWHILGWLYWLLEL